MTTTALRQTLKLYSEECVSLLDEACVKQGNAEDDTERGNETITPFPLGYEFFEVPESTAEDDELQEESDASSSEESSSLPVEDPDPSLPTAAALPVAASTTTESPVPAGPTPSSTKPSKPSTKQANQRQLEQQIQQHIELLNHHPVPVDDQSALFIPTSLLQSHHNLTWTRDVARNLQTQPLVILLLRSGRFAGAVFQQDTCLHHTTSTRYTVRKGQGKAQSSQDAKRRPKSVGSQLRRAGEQALKDDIQQTLEQWKSLLANAALILISAPKTMRATLFETFLDKKDSRIRNIPLDVGRPTMEATRIVQAAMMTVWVGPWEAPVSPGAIKEPEDNSMASPAKANGVQPDTTTQEPIGNKDAEILPLTDLHLAARDGNLPRLLDLLRDPIQIINVNGAAGYDFMTPLHFAAEAQADACVSALLVQGQADPTRLDARRRVPYFLATTDKTRESFRTARAILGEDIHDWECAKVGPPLTEQEMQLRKEKEAEKKRRKKAKQKEKKAQEKSHEEEMEQRRQQQLAQQQAEEEAKRIRDALPPKQQRGGGNNVCDFCQTEVKGKKRQQILHRLDYYYCSTDCVQKHKRELMAKAAMERFQ